MRIAIIPARGGSKRIKDKNIVDFCGRPLIAYSLTAAKNSDLFDEIHVSTESPKIKSVVEELGFPVPFLRSSELATDSVGILPVLKEVVQNYRGQGKNVEEVALILPTAPLLRSDDLVLAHQQFLKFERKFPTMSCCPYPVPVDWALQLTQEGLLKPRQKENLEKRSQDLGRFYYDVGAFSFLTAHQIENGFESQYIPYFLPRERAVDIDTEDDLKLAETLFRGLGL